MKVAVIYHQFPHYRAPILRELATAGRHDYKFHGSIKDFEGIKAFKGDDIVSISPLEVTQTRRGFKISGCLHIATDKTTDALLIIGNPNILETWLLGLLGRLTGKKIIYWAHGWLCVESQPKRTIRKVYYSIAHMLLVYGERSVALGISQGYPSGRVRAIYNSLDFQSSTSIIQKIEGEQRESLTRALFLQPDRPLLICTARLTDLCRFDLLISAAHILSEAGMAVNVLLVGDGPARSSLAEQARRLSVDVFFYGSCYDESIIGRLIYEADATVSPGKIGLTAIHSLSYGTPAFTHGDLNHQMPEVEAITPGLTGDFFRKDSAEDLAERLKMWFKRGIDRQIIRKNCRTVISDRWNPAIQRELIEKALDAISSSESSR